MKRTPLVRKTPLRRASTKRARELRLYAKESNAWLVENTCKPCRSLLGIITPAEQCHHVRGRCGALLNDKRFWLPVCAFHHEYIHNNPKWARANAYLASASAFNRLPP